MKTYKINEIFYSLQGEGYYTGTPAIFIRFSGCNLHCPYCDTDHSEGRFLTGPEIFEEVEKYPSQYVVLTGGEPSLFIDRDFVISLHSLGKTVAIETNGTHPLPDNIDWVTLSPKFDVQSGAELSLEDCDEIKVIYHRQDMSIYSGITARHHFLQPCDTGDPGENGRLLAEAVEFCKSHPHWRLSVQMHKFIGIH